MIIRPPWLSTIASFLVNRLQLAWQLFHQECLRRPCLLCDEATWDLSGLCSPCLADLPWNVEHCLQCALPLPLIGDLRLRCGDCLRALAPFDLIQAPFRYEFPIDAVLHQYKYQGKRYWSKRLSALIAAHLYHQQAQFDYRFPQALIPVPLHRERQRERRYNQSALLAGYLGKWLGIHVDANWLTKQHATPAQVASDKKARLRNLRNAFALQGQRAYQHVALIDDVVTTRATVEVLARLLKQNGVQRVDVWALARTPKQP